MKVIVHHPKKTDDVHTLRKVVAAVHAEAVLRYISKLSCPSEEKTKLLNAVIEAGSR